MDTDFLRYITEDMSDLLKRTHWYPSWRMGGATQTRTTINIKKICTHTNKNTHEINHGKRLISDVMGNTLYRYMYMIGGQK